VLWETLLDDIKVRSAMPTSQNTFTEARFLSLTNAELRSRLVPIIDKVRENFYLYDVDTALNATGAYDIHKRAVGAKLFTCALISDLDRKDLAYYSEEEIHNYDSPPGDFGFFFRRSQVHLVPRVPAGWENFRQTILLQPGRIVPTDEGAQITAINTSTGLITCDAVPSTWSTANTFDLVQAEAHFDTLGIDLEASSVVTGTAGTVTLAAADLPSRLVVGDYISLAGQTPVVQCPDEFLPLLAQYVANIALKSQTDVEAYKLGVEDAKQLKEGLMGLVSPRVQKEGKKIVNRSGMLRRGGGF
jgi:hypothetical protein